ncbi:Na+/H+ antiporter NhaA [Thalassotalea ponticola]|uniref:Na+/H+ antiporter NhaA n=1 Tax=Thalassotalea ponticola TaxID=1523392 RepID=UPI0025B468FD|nr:Na+/H+ antiporter NhaA [Thalassotalea ponticola]MDN3651196.1 Na+/H+ antiporter NhaA [Thalassotalea ponticola]
MKTEPNFIVGFFKLESSGGIILMMAAVLAMIFANTSLSVYYDLFLSTPVAVKVGPLEVAKPLLLWINDGLMAVFFFLVGLELKRELREGELKDPKNIVLPGIGAIGGMLIPALVYAYFNYDNPEYAKGWAIPAATDIAFALGVLMLLGSRVPATVKIFLTSLAIFDDIGAIIIIACFYTDNISFASLVVVASCIPILWWMNHRKVEARSLYMMIGIIMWVAMLKSGVHATLSGVLVALFIPMRSKTNPDYSPLKSLEHDLHSVVAFFVLPVFAFANAGLNLSGMSVDDLLHPVPLGIALGLLVGKQIGVFGFCYLAIKAKLTELPAGMSFKTLYGTSALCGIGFTMSLFIGSLTFEGSYANQIFDERIGIVIGSLISGFIGFFVLRYSLPKHKDDVQDNEVQKP